MTILEKNRNFFDMWASFYDHGPIAWWLRYVQRYAVKTISASHVLDASCGTGHALDLLAQRGCTIVGLDLSAKMLKHAQDRLEGIPVKLVQGNVSNLPFDNEFDVVLSTEAFHHYHNQKLALKEFYRVLRPGGTLLLIDIEFAARPIHWLFEKLEPGCVKVNSKEQIQSLIKETGFELTKQERVGLVAVATYAQRPPNHPKHL